VDLQDRHRRGLLPMLPMLLTVAMVVLSQGQQTSHADVTL
jgi:hypothetical protein